MPRPRLWAIIICAVLVSCGLALFLPSHLGMRSPIDWAKDQWVLFSVRGGPGFVAQVDREALRRRRHENLRSDLLRGIRDICARRSNTNPSRPICLFQLTRDIRVTDTGVEVFVLDTDVPRAVTWFKDRFNSSKSVNMQVTDKGVIRLNFTEYALQEYARQALLRRR